MQAFVGSTVCVRGTGCSKTAWWELEPVLDSFSTGLGLVSLVAILDLHLLHHATVKLNQAFYVFHGPILNIEPELTGAH